MTAQVVGSITLTWLRAPTSDGGSDITGYEIQILDISTRTWVPAPEATVADDVLTYTNTGLEPGKTYYYILRAVNSIGAGPWSAFVSSASGVGPPDAPVLTAESAGRSSIDLSWTVPNNNGTPITGYQIHRWIPPLTELMLECGPPMSIRTRTGDNDDTVTEDHRHWAGSGNEVLLSYPSLDGPIPRPRRLVS